MFSKRVFILYLVLIALIALYLLKSVFENGMAPPKAAPILAENNTSTGVETTTPRFTGCLTEWAPFKSALAAQKATKYGVSVAPNGSADVQWAWRSMPAHFNEIWAPVLSQLDVHKAVNSLDSERKYFIAFSPNMARPYPCHIVTMGVGHSVDAEKQFLAIYNECKLLAVDPSSEVNEALVKAIGGTFMEAAIGGLSASKQPINVWDKDFKAERKEFAQIGIIDFMWKLRMNPVDLMLIDVEGAEFGIIEQFVENFAKMPRTVCQLNMEVHFPNVLDPHYTYERFYAAFNRWMRSGRFALMRTQINEGPLNFLRFFLVNVVDEKCVRKFLCH